MLQKIAFTSIMISKIIEIYIIFFTYSEPETNLNRWQFIFQLKLDMRSTAAKAHNFVKLLVLPTLGRTFWPVRRKYSAAEKKSAAPDIFVSVRSFWSNYIKKFSLKRGRIFFSSQGSNYMARPICNCRQIFATCLF